MSVSNASKRFVVGLIGRSQSLEMSKGWAVTALPRMRPGPARGRFNRPVLCFQPEDDLQRDLHGTPVAARRRYRKRPRELTAFNKGSYAADADIPPSSELPNC